MIPAGAPEKPDPVTTVIDNVYVRFSWTAPESNGANIDAYNLWILKADGFTLAQSESCDGTSDPLVVQNRECLVPMAELTDPSLFNLPQGRQVSAKLQASNSAGTSDYSSFDSNAVLVETVPSAPQNVQRGALTTETQIDVDWDALTLESQRGGPTASILSYRLEWDKGSGTDLEWETLIGVLSHYTDLTFVFDEAG